MNELERRTETSGALVRVSFGKQSVKEKLQERTRRKTCEQSKAGISGRRGETRK